MATGADAAGTDRRPQDTGRGRHEPAALALVAVGLLLLALTPALQLFWLVALGGAALAWRISDAIRVREQRERGPAPTDRRAGPDPRR
jgi:apolipoprotein N-acyltransferase